MELLTPGAEALIWILGGLLLMVAEFIVPGTFIIFVGFGAVVAGAAKLWFTLSTGATFLVWAVATALTIPLGTALLRRIFPAERLDAKLNDDSLTSHNGIARVVEEVAIDRGRIDYLGTEWNARLNTPHATPIASGSEVRVLRRDNITYLVEPHNANHSPSNSHDPTTNRHPHARPVSNDSGTPY